MRTAGPPNPPPHISPHIPPHKCPYCHYGNTIILYSVLRKFQNLSLYPLFIFSYFLYPALPSPHPLIFSSLPFFFISPSLISLFFFLVACTRLFSSLFRSVGPSVRYHFAFFDVLWVFSMFWTFLDTFKHSFRFFSLFLSLFNLFWFFTSILSGTSAKCPSF